MRSLYFLILIAELALWTSHAIGTRAAAADRNEFGREIKPILERHCLECHNDRDPRGGLSLQTAEAARRGGESGPVIVGGDPNSSYLLDLVTPSAGKAAMPQGAPSLAPDDIATLRDWISDGAKWPTEVVLALPRLWSLQPVRSPPAPVVSPALESFLIRTPIDAFVASRLSESGLIPARPADRHTLIRRLSLDLTGLPPTPAAVEAFLADDAADAYERLVDRLLASPHFGERWGRYWLDLARYADSEGYLGDALRPYAWVYREWVIDAINRDLPFDQFTIEQLAGDLLETPTLDQHIATGFHRNTLRNTEAGVDLELYRTKEIVDRVNTTGMVWLGLTLGCAECHDHKHDPISQTDFYRFYAFFNNADEIGVPVTRDWETTEYKAQLRSWQPTWDRLVASLAEYEQDNLSEDDRQSITDAFVDSNSSPDWDGIVNFYLTDADGWDELKSDIDAHFRNKPARPATKARAFTERESDRRDTFVHLRGVYTRHGAPVTPGTPAILPALASDGDEPNRLDLARWLFDEENPLTPRVAVNRIWLHLFGHGLVSTPNDFGTAGTRPTHPQLLDWLATEYRRRGWSRKAMIRLIVTSSTYRLSSRAKAVPAQQDLGNELLWRQNSYRVSAEIVRDLHLAASGLLDRTIGRRGIRPPLPSFVTDVGRSVKWPVSTGGARYRRGVYIFFKRTVPYPMLMAFDAPDSAISCSRRERSNTPLQALTLLNDPVFFECAAELATRVAQEHGDNLGAAVNDLFLNCLGRAPTTPERRNLVSACQDIERMLQIESGEQNDSAASSTAAMTALSRIVMNLDEFITRD